MGTRPARPGSSTGLLRVPSPPLFPFLPLLRCIPCPPPAPCVAFVPLSFCLPVPPSPHLSSLPCAGFISELEQRRAASSTRDRSCAGSSTATAARRFLSLPPPLPAGLLSSRPPCPPSRLPTSRELKSTARRLARAQLGGSPGVFRSPCRR
eukprot:762707-Hanusia_phi.AAC.2